MASIVWVSSMEQIFVHDRRSRRRRQMGTGMKSSLQYYELFLQFVLLRCFVLVVGNEKSHIQQENLTQPQQIA